MPTNTVINLEVTRNADGYTIGGGIVKRNLSITGGNVSITGSGSAVITFPTSTATLATLALAETLTNKTLTSPTINSPTINSWAGSTSITTLGTITSGTWTGTAIAVARGGTGATDATTARSNLGLVIGTNVQAYSATLASWSGKSVPTGAVVGTTDSQSLSSKTISSADNTLKPHEFFTIAVSDESTNLTTGTAKVTFRMPYAFTLTGIRINVNTAPSGSAIIVDVREAGVTIFSVKPQIASAAKTNVGGTVGTFSDTSLADDAEMTVNIDQVGVTTPGKGLKLTLIGYRT